MKTAGIEMEKFSGCVEEYGKRCDSKAEDAFYRAMRGEDDRYESSFSPEQVEELLSQLRAGKNYLGLRNFETVEEYIASLHGDFDESFGTGAGSYYYSDNTYLKPIGETLSIGGKVIGVPPFHICLMSAYGDDAGENGSEYGNGKDLRKSVRGINDRIKEQASVEEAYAYSMDLFEDVPSGINSGNPSVFEDIDGDSNYGAVSQYRSMSATVANLLSILEEGIRGIRDNLFISEYVKQNFSCLTTKADQTTMTGTPIDQEHNRIYGCEIEYILFGNKGCKEKKFLWFTVREEAGPESNLATAKISIFAVRFVCNSIFALTDTEIDQITLAPAISIQAASGGLFPYRLAQVTMKLALALAESFVDLDSLIHGEKVPILKSKLTWRCSVQGILEMLRGRVTEEISEAVQKGFQKGVGFLQRCVDDTADFTAESAGEYIEGLSADLRTAITANIEQAVSSVIMSLREAAERGFAEIFSRASFSRDDFIQSCREELSGIFEGFDEETQEVLSGVLPLIENDVIRSMSDILSDIASDAAVKAGGGDTIYVLEEALCSRITSEISDIFSSFIEQAENEIKGRIDRIIASASDDLKSSISSYGDRLSKTAAEKLTETAVELLDRYLPSSGDMQLPAGDMDLGGEDIPSLKLGLFGETIMCPVILRLPADTPAAEAVRPSKEEILLRIADVIQLNLALSHKSGDAFRMSKAYTYAEIKAVFRIPSLILPRSSIHRLRNTMISRATERTRDPVSRRGSVTVEASISIALFAFAMVSILSLINICRLQRRIGHALNCAALDISRYSYFFYVTGGYDAISTVRKTADDLIDGIGHSDNSGIGSKALAELAKVLLADDQGTTEADFTWGGDTTDVSNEDPISLLLSTLSERVEDKASGLIAGSIVRAMFRCELGLPDTAADRYLRSHGVIGGWGGLDFEMSRLWSERSPYDISLAVRYRIRIPFLPG